MAPRRHCPTCGSRQWHKEPSSGLIACSEGHILQNYRNEAIDADDDLGPHALKKRNLKSKRQIKGRESKADPRFYHGARGRFFYFQCLQLILRHQIPALMELWTLPAQFELICRDIWALHVSSLVDPIPPEPLEHEIRLRDGKPKENPATPNPLKQQAKKTNVSSAENSDASTSDSELDDLVIAALMRENSESECSAYAEEDKKPRPMTPKAIKKITREHEFEMPISTIAVLTVAAWTLRVPLIYQDLLHEVANYNIPYLDPLRLLPDDMVRHLTKQAIQALSPRFTPSVLQLHKHASHLAKVLKKEFGIVTPEANATPILWRCVRSLGGTPVIYYLAKRLGQVLSLPLVLHHSLAPQLETKTMRATGGHRSDRVPPEVLIFSSVLIVTKMIYGLDGQIRVPERADDPACAVPRIDEFFRSLLETKETEIKSSRNWAARDDWSVGDLNEAEVGAYLDFCENALLGRNYQERDAIIPKYFSLTSMAKKVNGDQNTSGVELGRTVRTERAMASQINREGSSCGPGTRYTIYSARDVLGEVHEEYERLLLVGTRWLGIDIEVINSTVEGHERRLAGWWHQEKRDN